MPLFFARWHDNTSILIDTLDVPTARKRATELAAGAPPADVIAFPQDVFVAEVFLDDDAAPDEGELVVQPLQFVEDVLYALDQGEPGTSPVFPIDTRAPTEPAPPSDAPGAGTVCGSTTDDGGEIVHCERLDGHDGEHEGTNGNAEVIVWDNENEEDDDADG